jgi:hypothetical protein
MSANGSRASSNLDDRKRSGTKPGFSFQISPVRRAIDGAGRGSIGIAHFEPARQRGMLS